MRTKCKIYVPVGITGSGKTKACKKWVKENQPAACIKVYKFREMFSESCLQSPGLEERLLRSLVEGAVFELLYVGHNVAIDDGICFLTKEDRRHWEELLPWYEIVWDFLPAPTKGKQKEGGILPPSIGAVIASLQRKLLEPDNEP